jgi:hypothetical protein
MFQIAEEMKIVLILLLITVSQYVHGQDLINKNKSEDSQLQNDEIEKRPMMFFNDKIIESLDELNNIDVEDVQEIVVIKDSGLSSYINKYGPNAQNGIVLIYSKDFVANRWFTDFAKLNNKLQMILAQEGLKYTDYIVYLNKTQLEREFFNGLEAQLDDKNIKSVKFKQSTNGSKGKISIKTD